MTNQNDTLPDLFGGTEPWTGIQVRKLISMELTTKLTRSFIVQHLTGAQSRENWVMVKDACVDKFRSGWAGQGLIAYADLQILEFTEPEDNVIKIKWRPSHNDCIFYGGPSHGYRATLQNRGEAQIVTEKQFRGWAPVMGSDQFYIQRHIYVPDGYDWSGRNWIMRYERTDEDLR